MNNWNSGAEKDLSGNTPKNVRKFTYVDIYNATKNFTSKIGEGGFGAVYRAKLDFRLVAVKKLKSPEERDFINELKTLTRFQHENLLSIIGYCDDPTCPSIVLEYMPNGSLENKLEDKSTPLPWDVRSKIAYGAALGINHLHTSGVKPMVHRDIKSANILLNKNFVPKVADFGFVRDGDSGLSKIRPVTLNYCYTLFYEAPEVQKGDVSIKLDTFSFGVVLLELLTGLKPFHEGKALRNYTKRQILGKLLDSSAQWDKSTAEKLYKISKCCLKKNKKTRPTISQILGDLKKCLSHSPAAVPSVSGVTQGYLANNYYWPPSAVGDDASSTDNSSYCTSFGEVSATSTENSSYCTSFGEVSATSTENSSYCTSSAESSSSWASSEEGWNIDTSSEESSGDDTSSEENSYAERTWKIWQNYLNSPIPDIY